MADLIYHGVAVNFPKLRSLWSWTVNHPVSLAPPADSNAQSAPAQSGANPALECPPRCFNSRQRIVDALHSYLLDGWKQLPERNRRLLGLDPQASDLHDEEALSYLAYIFIDCANLTLDRAVAAKRARMLNG